MTKQPNDAAPDLIVLGLHEGQPRAAKFPASQADLVAKAAKAMSLTVCKAEGPDLVDLTKKLQEGRLYATGRGFVPPIRHNLYDQLVEQLRLAGQPVPDQAQAEQPAQDLPSTWDDIAVGHLVIAHEGASQGWWEAIVLARDGDMLTLKWRDCHRQWETDPPGTLNLTHRIRWFLREGGADAEGGGADGIGGFEEARGEHPGSVAVYGTVSQHGSAVFARWRCGGQA